MKSVPPMVREIESSMRKMYSDANLDRDVSFTVNLQKFIYGLASRSATEQEVLREAVRFIYHSFGFKEITIPLRSSADGKYRYEVFLGMTREAEQSYRKLVYSHEDVFNDGTYPGVKLSKQIELALAELEPYVEGEEGTYNRPTMLNVQRESAEQMLDSDYYSIYLIGPGDDTFGWLELSGHKDGKFPPMKTLRQLELFSTVLSLILSQWRVAPKKVGAQNSRVR